jgi:formylglycine-generating enzyme required for sulfatase activity
MQHFLNAVACKEDAHNLYHTEMGSDQKVACILRSTNADSTYHYDVIPGMDNLPITYVCLSDAERFSNWKGNGSPTADQLYDFLQQSTEIGAYNFSQDRNGKEVVSINSDAPYHIPSQNEWIKAAYYSGNGTNSVYWMYPTQHENVPSSGVGDITNLANYQTYGGRFENNFLNTNLMITAVDCFSSTVSFYQAGDMGGNVAEWTTDTTSLGLTIARGGSWESEYNWYYNNDLMRVALPKGYDPSQGTNFIGFRIAASSSEIGIVPVKNLPSSSPGLETTDSNKGLTPNEKIFLGGMAITGAMLTGVAGVFVAGEFCLGLYEGSELAEIAAAFPTRRLIMMGLHLLVNSVIGGVTAVASHDK